MFVSFLGGLSWQSSLLLCFLSGNRLEVGPTFFGAKLAWMFCLSLFWRKRFVGKHNWFLDRDTISIGRGTHCSRSSFLEMNILEPKEN